MVRLPDEIQKEAFVPASAIAKGVGKILSSVGDNAVGVLGKWFRKSVPEAVNILERRTLKEIPDAIHHAQLFESKLGKEISEATSKAVKQIEQAISKKSSALAEVSKEVDRSKRQLVGLSRRKDPETMELAKTRLNELLKKEQVLSRDLKTLHGYNANIKTNPQSVATQIESMPALVEKYPELGHWHSKMTDAMNIKNQIMNSTSKNINNDKKFFKEYVDKIARLPDDNLIKNRWMANPENRVKLESLRENAKFGQGIMGAEGVPTTTTDISGITKSKIQKTLGVGAMGASVMAGAIGLFNWAAGGSERIDRNADALETLLQSASSSDLGLIILNDVRASVRKISIESDNLKLNMDKDPKNALSKYIKILQDERSKISKNLRQWNVVVLKSQDKETAQKLGIELQKFNNMMGEELSKVSGVVVDSGALPSKPLGDSRVVTMQRYLKTLYPNLNISGEIDGQTISALRSLEDKYNKIAQTDKFTGLIYNPQSSRIMELQDLINLEKVIK